MNVIVTLAVKKFVDALDTPVRADVNQLIDLLETYGHLLTMPYAKPIGGGLWELRRTGKPQVRMLYGFCRSDAILVHVVKKQRSALRQADIELARKRLADYCST